ncbi:MMPL family transporter [Marinimicrobium sp. ABcell2]|uniref:MMPL family transporter n=1 Tax=Marinimicrobium sp. ABcell2 TaxID=3069751 RepID=UPI0027B59E62|nr:MMPL family transporter [Marinimicrobium sp. ABcell2]MDQ2076967.1 MMPL family transporter [Marinimicrobium sp. ABcell2]
MILARRVSTACLLLVVLAVLLFVFSLPRLQFDNDILALFPDSADFQGQSQADQLLAERITRQVFLLLSADDYSQIQEAAELAVETLQACDCFAHARLEVDAEPTAELHSLYAQYLPVLLTPEIRSQIQAGDIDRIAQNALRRLLTNPGTGLTHQLRQDPLGTLSAYLREVRPGLQGVQLDDRGYLSVRHNGQRFVLIQAELAGSPYGLTLQSEARAALNEALEPVRALDGAEVIHTGALFYTLSGSDQARQEISTVGLGSLLGICLLLLLVFRSPWLLLLASMPIALGVAAGLSVTYWVFGSVHVIALVFGASLTGVAIDYTLHFFARRQFQGSAWQPSEGLAHLLAPLTLGLITSVAGYLSFTLAGFPGFSQIAVFSAAGLIVAYATVMGVFPRLLTRSPKRPLSPTLVRGLEHWRSRHWRIATVRHPGWLVLVAAIFLAMGLSQWRINDDIRTMQVPDPSLQAMESQFREALGERTALQYLLVDAASRQRLLERLERVGQALDELVSQDALDGYQSLAQWLPSQAWQRENRQLWDQLLEAGALAQVLDELQVSEPFRAELHDRLTDTDKYLRWDETWPTLSRLPDAPVYFTENERHFAAVTLRGLESPALVAERVAELNSVHWVDPVARTNRLLADYRRAAGVLLLLAYGGIALLLTRRYGAKGALFAVAPPAIASLASLAILLTLGQSINVFNIMALLLVLGIGVDYTLFLRESLGKGCDTLLAIGLSTCTTVLSFGLLSLSSTAAISSFGLTLLIGIVLAFALAPLTLKGINGGPAKWLADNN